MWPLRRKTVSGRGRSWILQQLMCGVNPVRYLLPKRTVHVCFAYLLHFLTRVLCVGSMRFYFSHVILFPRLRTSTLIRNVHTRFTMYHRLVTGAGPPDTSSSGNGASLTSTNSSNVGSSLSNSTTASTAPDPSGGAYAEGPSLTQTPSPTTIRDFASPGLGRGRMRIPGDMVDTRALREPITFAFSGRTAKNRLLKAPMTERLCRWNEEGEDIVGLLSPVHQSPSQLALFALESSLSFVIIAK